MKHRELRGMVQGQADKSINGEFGKVDSGGKLLAISSRLKGLNFIH